MAEKPVSKNINENISEGPRRGVSPRAVRRGRSRITTKLELLKIAGELVGQYGYAGCSVARLTARADIAHGAFYTYFSSQQELFDQLLPTLSKVMLREVSKAIRYCRDPLSIERQGFAANFEFLRTHPYMYRVLTEAELFAPETFYQIQKEMADGYARSLYRSLSQERKDVFSVEEMKIFATLIIGARTYLLMGYGVEDGVVRPLSEAARNAYLAFAENALRRFDKPEET